MSNVVNIAVIPESYFASDITDISLVSKAQDTFGEALILQYPDTGQSSSIMSHKGIPKVKIKQLRCSSIHHAIRQSSYWRLFVVLLWAYNGFVISPIFSDDWLIRSDSMTSNHVRSYRWSVIRMTCSTSWWDVFTPRIATAKDQRTSCYHRWRALTITLKFGALGIGGIGRIPVTRGCLTYPIHHNFDIGGGDWLRK